MKCLIPRTFPRIVEEPFFECVRLRRTHSKNEPLLIFRIDTITIHKTE
jgi:hypothetical protein